VNNAYNETHFRDDGTLCRLGAECPISPVHARLHEAHRHWHHADASYAEPDAFRSYLNSCIQALRNVTFVLQKHKSLFLDFDRWYAPWQSSLRNDAILRWIVSARNTIVKMGDLETLSIARASILDDYASPAAIDFVVPSAHSSVEIAHSLIPRFEIPDDVVQNGIFRLERRWITTDLPEFELLDALAHAFAVLACLVNDAHRLLNEPRPLDGHVDELPGQRLACMTCPDEPRSLLVRLLDGHHLSVNQLQVPTEKLPTEDARAHYGPVPAAPDSLKHNQKDLRENCNYFFSLARMVMEKDGYHNPFAFLFLPNGQIQFARFDPTDRIDKLLIWRKIAQDVERLRAYAVISISEVWMAKFDPENPGLSPSDSPKRDEGLALDAVNSIGEYVGFHARIYRTSGEVILGETQDVSEGTPLYLGPVREVWKRMRQRASVVPTHDSRHEDDEAR